MGAPFFNKKEAQDWAAANVKEYFEIHKDYFVEWYFLLDVRQIAARQYVLLTKAPSSKLQAASVRQYVALTQDVVVRQYVILTEAPSDKLQAPSCKPQAPSHP